MSDADILFIDLESSGLHWGSYPIEFGWAKPDISASSFLVAPAPSWTEDLWSIESEIIHGIGRQLCVATGMPVRLAARRLNSEFFGKRVYSDNSEFDSYWTARLFEETGEVQGFTILPVEDLYLEAAAIAKGGYSQAALGLAIVATSATRQVYPHPHRAGPDAAGLAAAYRYIIDPQFRADIDMQVEAILELQFSLFDSLEDAVQ